MKIIVVVGLLLIGFMAFTHWQFKDLDADTIEEYRMEYREAQLS